MNASVKIIAFSNAKALYPRGGAATKLTD